jgi:DNA-binding MarR family transcriptional regulator
MSRGELEPRLDRKPLIALVERAGRALQTDMVRRAHADGHAEVKPAHNAVFGTLPASGARAADMAARAGVTRQSMGEVIRDMVGVGLLEMQPDPTDGRAKLVTYTDHGRSVASDGRRHLVALEERFAEEFGDQEYAVVRDVLARIVDLLDRLRTEEPDRDQSSPAAGGRVG